MKLYAPSNQPDFWNRWLYFSTGEPKTEEYYRLSAYLGKMLGRSARLLTNSQTKDIIVT